MSGIVARQTGQRNSARLLQDSVFPFLIQTSQTGTDNDIVIVERAGGFAGPVVTQEGNGNRARVEQYLDYYSGIGISQTGLRNLAEITQTDAYMTDGMSITQQGADNRASIANTGQFNSMSVTQLGNGATASASQSGTGNQGFILQH